MDLPITTPPSILTPPALVIKEEQKPPEKKLYTLKQGDVLEKVALSQNTTVQRIFDKNTGITHPDVIKAGETIEIPAENEALTERPMPSTIQATVLLKEGTAVTGGSSVSGGANLFPKCQCTWGAKNLRPDLPATLRGNGGEWYRNAQALGLATGTEPRIGAAASTYIMGGSYGHVGVVVGIEGGRIKVKEMNVRGCFYSEAWYNSNDWKYIY